MSAQSNSRRRFLKTGCLAAGAVGLTVCGASLVALAPDPSPVALPSLSYGEGTMNNRILVAYATYAGSTAEVAAEIGKMLGQRGFSVDVKPIKEKPSLDGYTAVLVGSAVQRGKWLPEAVDFVKTNQGALNRVPVALFCVHITNTGNDEKSRQTRLTFLNEVRPLVPRASEVFFPGRFDRRGAALLMPGFVARFVPTFDLRDWTKIRAWAQAVFA
ncbi:MAG: flavodoxin domain-containing protein [Chloroflexi bacterium]|nr:flavodoxin domain-containing protein [Chloroflexota bacterium]